MSHAAETPRKDPNVPIIELRDVEVVFTTRAGSGLFHKNRITAVNKVNLKLMPGQTIGIVGESGCGKSTTANVMCGLQQATSGKVLFKGQDVTHRTAKERMDIGRVVSVVFQDPATALNARMSVIDQLLDPLVVHKLGSKEERDRRAHELIRMVGLPTSVLGALPGQLSGGQRHVSPSPAPCRSSRTRSSPTSPPPRWTSRCAHRSSTCSRTSRGRSACRWCSSATTSKPSATSPTR